MSNGLVARVRVRPSESFVVDVVLSLAPGRTVALLGPNGAGKSTVVAALAGLLPIDEGRIMVGDTIVDDPGAGIFVPPEERAVGVVFQDYLLFPHLSVIENVAFGLRGAGVRRETALDRAGAWLESMDLGSLARSRPDDLSGGQRQQVALARALAIEPDVLLLDEPLSALDVSTRMETRRALSRHLWEFAGPRLLITHDPTEAFLLADNVYVIEGGVITQAGTADDIRLRPKTPYAADLAGANLIAGRAAAGVVEADGHRIHIADHTLSGPVLATIQPSAISVHLHKPEGSPRNTWRTSVGVIEPLGDRVRLTTVEPLPLTVEITEEARQALRLVEGSSVWLSIKATEIAAEPGP